MSFKTALLTWTRPMLKITLKASSSHPGINLCFLSLTTITLRFMGYCLADLTKKTLVTDHILTLTLILTDLPAIPMLGPAMARDSKALEIEALRRTAIIMTSTSPTDSPPRHCSPTVGQGVFTGLGNIFSYPTPNPNVSRPPTPSVSSPSPNGNGDEDLYSGIPRTASGNLSGGATPRSSYQPNTMRGQSTPPHGYPTQAPSQVGSPTATPQHQSIPQPIPQHIPQPVPQLVPVSQPQQVPTQQQWIPRMPAAPPGQYIPTYQPMPMQPPIPPPNLNRLIGVHPWNVVVQHAHPLNGFVPPHVPDQTFGIGQKADFWSSVPMLKGETNFTEFRQRVEIAATASGVASVLDPRYANYRPMELLPNDPNYEVNMHAFRTYQMLEHQTRALLVGKLPSDIMRWALHGSHMCLDIWMCLISRYQVANTLDTAGLIKIWMNRSCANDSKVNLRKWLEEDEDIIRRIGDAGGIISDQERKNHVLTSIPLMYKTYIGQMNDTMKINSNGTRELSTQEIIDLLHSRYLFLHPELPSWSTSSTEKSLSSSKTSDPTKDPKNVALQASSTPGGPSTSMAGKSGVSMETQCYNCKGFGHLSRDCPTPKQKPNGGGNGSRGKNWCGRGHGRGGGNPGGHGGANMNNGGNAANVEGAPKAGNTTSPSVAQNQNPKPNMQQQNLKPAGQAGMVENIDFAYMAEPSSDISEDSWLDNEYEEEILVPLSPKFLNRPVSQIVDVTDEEMGALTSEELDSIDTAIKDLGNQLPDEKRKLLWQINATLVAQHASQWLYEKFAYEVWEDKENDESDSEDDDSMDSDDEREPDDVPDAQGGNDIYMCVTDLTFIPDDGISIDESSEPVVMQTDSMEPTVSVFAVSNKSISSKTIVLDSGCTHHMSPDPSFFSHTPKPCPSRTFQSANRGKFTASSQGAAEIRTGEGTIPVRNVLYVPELANTLVSIGELDDAGYTVTFGGGQAVIRGPDGKVCGSIPKSNGLYRVVGNTSNRESYAVVERLTLDEFHRRMGHIANAYHASTGG
ncbi:hypothetical protein D9758_007571 [Tetrapyrgos nigripes]|uniref:CCHC-type domain-containing protein n=1 Tax=Tetrapyrgos nigripes TaxID=182062 RepID=A0A8H5G816_9AGAR|nr:hypothetical protein D9758_007571 [Tetrapyrgos nigripes]